MIRSLFGTIVVYGAFLASAAEVAAAPPSPAEVHDLWQTVRARKLLLEDPLLSDLNLGVRVTNRVALLWGPVPSVELALRAEQLVRTMFELNDVRNQLVIDQPLPMHNQRRPMLPPFLPDALPPVLPKPATAPLNLPAQPKEKRASFAAIDLDVDLTPREMTALSSRGARGLR